MCIRDRVKLLDWEYAGMCDPMIDVAMCAIYSYYDEEQLDHLLRIYLKREPSEEEQFATYAYAALGGFLWSLWAVYKSVPVSYTHLLTEMSSV